MGGRLYCTGRNRRDLGSEDEGLRASSSVIALCCTFSGPRAEGCVKVLRGLGRWDREEGFLVSVAVGCLLYLVLYF